VIRSVFLSLPQAFSFRRDHQEVASLGDIQIVHLDGDDATRLGLDHIQALQTARVLLRVVGASQDLALQRGLQHAPTVLGLRLPGGPETLAFHTSIRGELDDHEVGGGHKRLGGQVLFATQRSQRHGLVLGATAYQDLHGIKGLLRFEVLEL